MEDIRVVHNEGADRYELHVRGEIASLATYRREGSTLVFDHTETLPEYGGRGFARKLVTEALEDVRRNGERVVPRCWFVADVMRSEPSYAELLAS
jgi:uncharacterized protein